MISLNNTPIIQNEIINIILFNIMYIHILNENIIKDIFNIY